MDMEVDLFNLGTVNTMFAALFRSFKWNRHSSTLPIGTSVSGKVDKQCAHFFGVTLSDEQAEAGIVVRVTSVAQSKFKLLYFEQDVNGGYGLALQNAIGFDMVIVILVLYGSMKARVTNVSVVVQKKLLCERTGKVTSAGMYFLHFQAYRMDSTLAIAKDPESAFFKRLEGLQPCEVSELKAGTHIFAVYGDNFFKTASYTIEALCAKSFEDTTEKLKDIEAQILSKRNELRQFETEYRKALAHYQEVTNRYSQEKQSVDELLKQRYGIHASFTVTKAPHSIGVDLSNGSTSKVPGDDESPLEEENSDGKDKSSRGIQSHGGHFII
ncbi:Chaperone protein dnaJ 15 [Hibiscus syriacus]|uniref:Chaperone protein dnaJ 15 n=1 Tax=Hibiscus syriacus TaxID=106335 RepID=A0A6A2X1F9_HIBSY|nr:Chaperone protein dnaJ 15 [Hibiscus syriacus]